MFLREIHKKTIRLTVKELSVEESSSDDAPVGSSVLAIVVSFTLRRHCELGNGYAEVAHVV